MRTILGTMALAIAMTGCQPRTGPPPVALVPAKPPIESTVWPQFRGNRSLQGHAHPLPPPLELVWEADAGAAVKGGAAIMQDHVFLGTEKGEVLCLNRKTGERIWTFATEGPIESTPLVIGNYVVVGSSDFYLYAIYSKSGKESWKFKTDNKILSSVNVLSGANGGSLFFGSYDHHLYQLDRRGRELARFKTGNYVHGTPSILFLPQESGKTASLIMRLPSLLALGGCDGNIYLLDADGLLGRGQIDAGAYIGASVCIAGDTGYVGTYGKEVLAFDLKTGDILWRFKSNFPFFSSAAYDGVRQHIYVGGRDKKLHALDANTGEPKWAFTTRGRVDSSPVIAGDYVYVGSDDGRLYAVHAETGEEAWSYDLGGRVSAEPAIAGGYLVIGSASGKVFAFRMKNSK